MNNYENEHPIKNLISSIASNPILSLFALVFLVQAYTMIYHLEKINDTLIAIHEDNVEIRGYIDAENKSSALYVLNVEELDDKVNEVLFLIRGGLLNER
jgi:hypothetical protein